MGKTRTIAAVICVAPVVQLCLVVLRLWGRRHKGRPPCRRRTLRCARCPLRLLRALQRRQELRKRQLA